MATLGTCSAASEHSEIHQSIARRETSKSAALPLDAVKSIGKDPQPYGGGVDSERGRSYLRRRPRLESGSLVARRKLSATQLDLVVVGQEASR